jgi:hypothetical protein
MPRGSPPASCAAAASGWDTEACGAGRKQMLASSPSCSSSLGLPRVKPPPSSRTALRLRPSRCRGAAPPSSASGPGRLKACISAAARRAPPSRARRHAASPRPPSQVHFAIWLKRRSCRVLSRAWGSRAAGQAGSVGGRPGDLLGSEIERFNIQTALLARSFAPAIWHSNAIFSWRALSAHPRRGRGRAPAASSITPMHEPARPGAPAIQDFTPWPPFPLIPSPPSPSPPCSRTAALQQQLISHTVETHA